MMGEPSTTPLVLLSSGMVMVSLKVSSRSSIMSGKIGMERVFVVSPGAKVMVMSGKL